VPNERAVGKIGNFWPISRRISETCFCQFHAKCTVGHLVNMGQKWEWGERGQHRKYLAYSPTQ